MNPSGASRNDIYRYPERWGEVDCLQQFQDEQTLGVEEMLKESEADAQLAWVQDEIGTICKEALQGLGVSCPACRIDTAWDIFFMILSWVRKPVQAVLGC